MPTLWSWRTLSPAPFSLSKPAPRPGSIPAELGSDIHAVVHQAAGMVSVQLDISVGDALVRLRAHAFATDRPLNEVGREVVARTLRFDDLDER